MGKISWLILPIKTSHMLFKRSFIFDSMLFSEYSATQVKEMNGRWMFNIYLIRLISLRLINPVNPVEKVAVNDVKKGEKYEW